MSRNRNRHFTKSSTTTKNFYYINFTSFIGQFWGISAQFGKVTSNEKSTEYRLFSLYTVLFEMGWVMGLEPTAFRATTWRSNQLSYTHRMARLERLELPTYCLEGSCSIQLSYKRMSKKMERVMGIEPTRPAWKAGILPLNYTRISFNAWIWYH